MRAGTHWSERKTPPGGGDARELDSTFDAFNRARAICRAASSAADKSHVKIAPASAKTVAAVERLARADRRIAATVEQWDADPDTFNTEAMPPGLDGGISGE